MIDSKVIPAQQRTIIADPVLPGYSWNGWSGDTQYLDNPNNKQAIVTMPDTNITVTSNYNILWANTVYGALYNWYSASDSRGFVAGWHLPTYAEFQTLQSTLGGSTVAGGHLKETGTMHWNSPNTGADNSSGFNARAGGQRDFLFSALYQDAHFWTTTYSFQLFHNSTTINIVGEYLSVGMSIRLIKDSGTATEVVIDGVTYPCVTIGGQCWMAENLKATHYADGSLISEVTDRTAWAALTTGAWCAYNNDHANL